MPLAQNERRPRYQVIASELRTQIVSGALGIDTMLPTEMELCERYDVSRYTVRAALRQLRELGLIHAPGIGHAGCFCSPKKQLRPISQLALRASALPKHDIRTG